MRTTTLLIAAQWIFLSFLLSPSTSQAKERDILYDKPSNSPYAKDLNGDDAAYCAALLHGNHPHRVLRTHELKGLYLYLRDNLKYREENLSFGHPYDESWHGFEFGNFPLRFIARNIYENTKSEYALYLDKASFRDIEKLHEFASRQSETLVAADAIFKELVRRALVLLGDDRRLIRALWIAAKDDPNAELPDLLAFREPRQLTDFVAEIRKGTTKMYPPPQRRDSTAPNRNPYINPQIDLLLARITRYGYLNIDNGYVRP